MMDKTAKEIMTTDVIVAKQDDSIADVANMLIAEKNRRSASCRFRE